MQKQGVERLGDENQRPRKENERGKTINLKEMDANEEGEIA